MISRVVRKVILISLIILSVSFCVYAADRNVINITVEIDSIPPSTQANYDNLWHRSDFIINLAASDTQGGVEDIYYKINSSTTQSVKTSGQPVISVEGANNVLEYWSVDKAGNEELPHNTIVGIKLDKTPPVINILDPLDDTAFSSSPITINGGARDVLSGIERFELEVEGDIYKPTIQANGSFSISDVNIAGGPNRITALVQDNAGNVATDENMVFLGWVLHLKVPYYSKAQDYYSGAACCQIILNYIRNGLAASLTQDEIYNYSHRYNYAENLKAPEMDPRAIDYALGHFDPYDNEDPNGQGDVYKGYNFNIEVFENDSFNNYLRDIIHWMAYPVTIDKWWLDGDLAAWPNTPVAAPAYGIYGHWIVINGASTTQDPIPEPHTRPEYTPNFTVYGLWLTDPASAGIGRDVYVTAQAAQETYLKPLITSDRFNGKYLHVAEPPPLESEAEVDIASPRLNSETQKVLEIAREVNTGIADDLSVSERNIANAKKHIYDAALVVNLKSTIEYNNKDLSKQLNLASIFDATAEHVGLDWKKIIDSAVLTDEKFKAALDGAQARSFVKVRRTDKEESFYYLIPFDKYINGQFLTYAAIIINSEDGSFKEASWVEAPTRFVQVSRGKAAEILLFGYPNLQNDKLSFELVWKPGKISSSPFYPYWRAVSEPSVYYITQNGEVLKDAE